MQIAALLKELHEQKASDLLLAAGNPPCLKIAGSLKILDNQLLTMEMAENLISSIIRPEELEEFKKNKELDTAFEDKFSRYRINLHYQKGSMAAAIRRIPREIPSLVNLGLPHIINSFITLERGLVLVTGPTGCGKSTTQAAIINQINSTATSHIITIEDPIEFVHTPKQSLIEQREIGIDTYSFGEALKRVLRQLPDVILIGEMRDLESTQMALTAAETGHLVISTLHTQDAAQAIDRIIDIFPPHHQPQVRTMLSLTIQGVIAQQLIPKKDGNGLVPAVEILIATPAIRNIIRKGATQDIYSMLELGQQIGMQTMDFALRDLVRKGAVSKEEALIHAINRERLEKLLSGTA